MGLQELIYAAIQARQCHLRVGSQEISLHFPGSSGDVEGSDFAGSASRTPPTESVCSGDRTHTIARDMPLPTGTRTQNQGEEMLLLWGGVASSEELSSPPKRQRLSVGAGRLVGAKATPRQFSVSYRTRWSSTKTDYAQDGPGRDDSVPETIERESVF